ncbi:chaperone protein DnaJ-like isoform X2 [Carya illinoinensis]|uniref:chaperone protein DnaJ-like isoform X2 n=1 Tax=Carya illinoinensis TaxID=32201 RepID=UPI001C7286F0|nr:chaperone protein DnaJ-like isoform X2 [Carya illinoinensis]
MENGEEKSDDFYAVLGLKKECTASELRNAYKKLAMRWHPDRCSALGNSKFVEEAKKKFQAIQQAYSVLSDANKRFLYDVGVYDSDDDENEKGEESFEELQELFDELFQGDIGSFGSSSQTTTCSSSSSSYVSYCETSGSSNKRNSSEMNFGKTNLEDTSASGFGANFQDFCFGAEQRRDARKQRGVRGVPGGGGRRSSMAGNKSFHLITPVGSNPTLSY